MLSKTAAAQWEARLTRVAKQRSRDNPRWGATQLARWVARYAPAGTERYKLRKIAALFRGRG